MGKQNHPHHAHQGVMLASWSAIALVMANIADGISIDPLAVVLFSSGMAFIGNRIASFVSYAMFSIITVLTAVLVSSYQGISVSSEQFFSPYFGIADFLILVMMWASPIAAWVTRNMDHRLIQTLKIGFSRAMRIELPRIAIPAHLAFTHFVDVNEVWADQFFYRIDFRRGPPVTV